MPRVRANGIEIEYERFGAPSAPAMLLIMGLGAQMILWDEEFCAALADRGFHVVRFDNRDVGRSTTLDEAGVPNVFAAMEAAATGRPVEAPYTLADMADDAVGLMDALDIARAHVVGASMGGMIAQAMADRHAPRMLTLTSIMSTTGAPGLPAATPEASRLLLTPAPTERGAYIEYVVEAWRVIGSPGFPFDEARLRARAARAFERGVHREGVARQFAAILGDGDRTSRLRTVKVPTLVIHGDADPLIPPAGGEATAAAIAGAELLVVGGMGHDLPVQVWPRILDAISAHARTHTAV